MESDEKYVTKLYDEIFLKVCGDLLFAHADPCLYHYIPHMLEGDLADMQG